jgi:hypothetical protein
MDINMVFHLKENLIVDYFPTSIVVVDESPGEEEGEVLDGIFLNDDQPFHLTLVQLGV